jgi:hypothetical protein
MVAAMAFATVVGVSTGVAVTSFGADGGSSTSVPTPAPQVSAGQRSQQADAQRWDAMGAHYERQWGQALYRAAQAGDPELTGCFDAVRAGAGQ